VVDEPTLAFLADYHFEGDVWGYAEGECYFPGSPVLVVESDFAHGVVLETLVLSILNHDSAVASAASRMTSAAGDRPCIEMGSRRTHEEAAVAAARAAYVAGFATTSNLEAGRRWGVPTAGTAAHAFTLLHDDERSAFEAQVASLGPGTTLLVDTYDVPRAVETAVEVAGAGLGAVRLDSGDLLQQAREVRAQLDGLGATSTRIVVTSDLDEYAIAALAAAPVDLYGVGTSLVTGSGAPTAGMVYKLVAREDSSGELVGVAKASTNKVSVAGRKYALRRRGPSGAAQAEVLGIGEPAVNDGDDRELLVPLLRGGKVVDPELLELEAARDRHTASLAELPRVALRLQRGEPAIPTVYED
jgi:nicotinate phosphoribosyltransferase